MKPRIFTTAFSKVYLLLVQKVEKKGRAKEEVDTVACWLTGYDEQGLTNLSTSWQKASRWRRFCGVEGGIYTNGKTNKSIPDINPSLMV